MHFEGVLWPGCYKIGVRNDLHAPANPFKTVPLAVEGGDGRHFLLQGDSASDAPSLCVA